MKQQQRPGHAAGGIPCRVPSLPVAAHATGSQSSTTSTSEGRDDRDNRDVDVAAWAGNDASDRACAALGLAGKALVVLWGVLATIVLLIVRLVRVLVPRRRTNIRNDVVLVGPRRRHPAKRDTPRFSEIQVQVGIQVTNAGRGLGRRLAVRFGLEAGLVVCWDPDIGRCMNTVWKRTYTP